MILVTFRPMENDQHFFFQFKQSVRVHVRWNIIKRFLIDGIFWWNFHMQRFQTSSRLHMAKVITVIIKLSRRLMLDKHLTSCTAKPRLEAKKPLLHVSAHTFMQLVTQVNSEAMRQRCVKCGRLNVSSK